MSKTKNVFQTTKEVEAVANRLIKILNLKRGFGFITKEECLNVVGIVGAAVAMRQEDTSLAGVINSVNRINAYTIDSATSMLIDACKEQLKKEENEL